MRKTILILAAVGMAACLPEPEKNTTPVIDKGATEPTVITMEPEAPPPSVRNHVAEGVIVPPIVSENNTPIIVPVEENNCDVVPLSETLGTVYYFCNCLEGASEDCRQGEDVGDYTSPDDPGRTIDEAIWVFGEMNPGDTIAFCRGGAFRIGEHKHWVNARCDADSRCTVRDYRAWWNSDMGEDEPVIHGGLNLADGGTSDIEEGYNFINLSLQGNGEGHGIFTYNEVEYSTFCNLDINGFRNGVYFAGSMPPSGTNDGRSQHLVLKDSVITNNARQGFLGGCDFCVLENNHFENNGFEGHTLNHNIYASGGEINDMIIRDNTLYKSSIVDGVCSGASFIVHGSFSGLIIENNLVKEDVGAVRQNCWGIIVNPGYRRMPEIFTDVSIRGNTVVNMGNVSVGIQSCHGCVIENNVVIQEQAFFAKGIQVPTGELRHEGDYVQDSALVTNNSIYYGPAASGTAIAMWAVDADSTVNHMVINNAIQYVGDNPWNCFHFAYPLQSFASIDYNLCHFPNASVRGSWEADMYLEDFHNQGYAMNCTTEDPLFEPIDISNPNLITKHISSPLVDSGHPMYSPMFDKNGKLRGSSPDIGAYELDHDAPDTVR